MAAARRLAFALLAAVAAVAAQTPAPPAIDQGGVVNGGSRMPASLPGAAIARGSRVIISGVRLGPDPVVRIGQAPVVVFTWSPESIDALIPSSAPLGPVSLTVTAHGLTSEPYKFTLVSAGFGFFTPEASAGGAPGDTITLSGSGVGDGPLTILVGGKPAGDVHITSAQGIDRVPFRIPGDAPLGCFVPVQAVTSDGRTGNAVSIAVHAPGQPCHDRTDWFRDSVAHASRAGYVVLARVDFRDFGADRFDYGIASFVRDESGRRPFPPLPPAGTCTLFTDSINLRQMFAHARDPGAWTSVPKPLPGNRPMHAGATLTVRGPDGVKILNRSPRQPQYYDALLGGLPPFSRKPREPLFLRPGAYTVSAEGGEDIGPFSLSLRVPRALIWTNRDSLGAVDRARGATVRWRAADKKDAILIAASSADRFSGDAALCLCLANAGDGHFTIPPVALANLPPTGSENAELSYLVVAEIPADPPVRIQARGLDAAFAAFVSATARVVEFR